MRNSDWMLTSAFLDPEREIEEAFGVLIDEPWGRTEQPRWAPAVDIDETEEAYIITIDVPGVCTDDIELRVRPREIEIHGTRTSSYSVATSTRIHTERVSGAFRRTFPLDNPVDPQSAECDCEDGVYQVRVRKLRSGGDN